MIHTLKVFLSTIVFCFILDMLWLGLIAKNLYDNEIGDLLKKTNGILSPNWPAAVFVYIAIAIGVIYFVLPKSQGSLTNALSFGALFGLVLYGVYDFTNLSILKGWSFTITVIDVCWGMVLCSATSAFAFFCKHWFSS